MFEQVPSFGVPPTIVSLLFATTLGLFIGLEREWSNKPAGIRTFALISLSGSIFTLTESEGLLVIGAGFILVFAILLGVRSLLTDEFSGLSLTTSMSMLVAYGIGILSGQGFYIEAVTIAFLSSLLLVLKRELHTFALNLSKEEIRSAVEFAIISFVVYPLLPTEPFGPWNAIDAQLIWVLVIAVSGLGFLNYILIQQYKERGFWVTGFFGGLVNSTAVIVALANRVEATDDGIDMAVSAILLANAAMAIRNAVLISLFIPSTALSVALPLGGIAVTGVILAYLSGSLDSDMNIDTTLNSPFSVRNALTFGGLFLIILLMSAGAQNVFGSVGFYTTTFLAGLVSSGSATTTAVTLVGSNQITPAIASTGVVIGTIASIIIKIGFVGTIDMDILKRVLIWNTPLVLIGAILAGILLFI